MAYSLKSSGQALDLVACVLVDDDGQIKDLCGNALAIHPNVEVATGSWKGANRRHFITSGSSYYAYGVSWATPVPSDPTVSDGFGVFCAMAGSGVGAQAVRLFLGMSSNSVSPGSGTGILRGFSTGVLRLLVLNSNAADELRSVTQVPTDNATPFSIGANYRKSVGQQFFYGLGSGNLGTDGTATIPLEASTAISSIRFDSIGGHNGQGHQNHKPYIWAIFRNPRTLSQMQALHDDWFGELIETGTLLLPTAPTIKATIVTSATSAMINWTDNSSVEASYTVELEDSAAPGVWVGIPANPIGANVTAALAVNLISGHIYRPRVRASNATGNSNWSMGSTFTVGSTTTQKLKILCHADMAGQTGIKGDVFGLPGASGLTGDHMGAFSGWAASSTLENGQAVIKGSMSFAKEVSVDEQLAVVFESATLGSVSVQRGTVIEE